MNGVTEESLKSDSPKTFDLAVVGLGPGGLAAALRAAELGKEVIAFTDRNDYIRQQRIILTPNTLSFLKKYKGTASVQDMEFFERIENESTAQTKDIEKYLFSKLGCYSNVQVVKFDKSKVSISNIQIQKDHNIMSLSSEETYKVRHILAADGAKHGTANLLQEKNPTISIDYQPSPNQERHQYHAAVQLRVIPGQNSSVLLPIKSESNFEQLQRLKSEYQWNESYVPKGYVFPNQERTEFSFAGEIPESIYIMNDEERPNALIKWVGERIYKEYGVSPEKLELKVDENQGNHRLQATVFKFEVKMCQRPIVDLGNKCFFGQVGDARRTPNFYLGHGLNDAIAGGAEFANTIGKPGVFDSTRYTQVIQGMDTALERTMEMKKLNSELGARTGLEIANNYIDKLITHIVANRKGRDEASVPFLYQLNLAKSQLNKPTPSFDKLYDALNKLKPMLEQHRDTNFAWEGLRFLQKKIYGALFNKMGWCATQYKQCEMTKSIKLMEGIKEGVGICASRPGR